MEYIKCSDIMDVRDGTHDSPKYITDGGFPLVTSKNIKNNSIDFENTNYISEEDYIKINQRSEVLNGDIIMPMIGTVGNPVLVNTNKKFAIKNVALFKLANNEKIDSKFFYYCLKSEHVLNQLSKQKRGGTQSFVSLSNLRELKIPLIDINTQKKIVEVLDKAQELIDKRKEQIKTMDELVKSRFTELFKSIKFDEKELFYFIKEGAGLSYGIVVPGEYCKDGIPMIRPTDYENDKINIDNLYRVDRNIEQKYAKTRLEGNEILVTVIGSNMGQIMLSDSRCIGMNVTRNLAVLRQDDNKINKYYLREFLLSEKSQNYLRGQVNTSTIKQLPLNKLKQMMIPSPPIELQNQFADFVNQVDKLKSQMEVSLKELEDNFNSLMQKAFKGELF